MSTEFQWEGHNIQIDCQPMPRYLWMATETVVTVDGREIGRAGGLGITDRIQGRFTNNNSSNELILEMKMDVITFVSVPYKLEINDQVVSQGRVRINNWFLFLVPIIASLCLCCPATLALLLWTANNYT